MRAPVLPIYVLAGSVATSIAMAQCVASSRGPNEPSWGGSIQLRNVNLPGSMTAAFRSGYDAWNQCPGANSSFPDFLESYEPDTGQVIDVRYVAGTNPENPAACGVYNDVQQEILLFESALLAGLSVPCTRPDLLADTVTHELGHVLGLKNVFTSGCGAFIMSPLARTGPITFIDRSIKNEECWKVDETQYTLFEQLLDACAAGDPNACNALGPCEYPDICSGSPLVVDLAADGFAFTDPEGGVKFDIDGDGTKERTAWTAANSDDSFLVLDRNRNGKVDGAQELFGDATPLIHGEVAHNGFQALFEFDVRTGGNHNGFIDPGDSIYKRLLLWRDANHDGISSADELRPLRQAGVLAIEIQYRVRAQPDAHGNWLRYWSIARREDRRVEVVDVFFKFEERE